MEEKIFSVNELLEAIYKKFDNLEQLGKKLGQSKQDVSAKLRRQSPKFLNQLKSVGITLPDKEEKRIYSVNPEIYFMQAEEILALKKRITELEKELQNLKNNNE